MSDSKAKTREKIQEITSKEIGVIINKLEADKELTHEDLGYIKLWIVGDAQSYAEMENSLEDWLKEIARLKSIVAGYENKDLSLDELMKLQGILEDAARVCADISNYLVKKERIERFQEAAADPASMDKEILKNILKSKLVSPNL